MEIDDTLVARKLALIQEGKACRAGLTYARRQLDEALRPEVLARHAAGHALAALRTRVEHLVHPLDVKALAPYALGLAGFARRHALGRPLLFAAGAAALGWWWSRYAATH